MALTTRWTIMLIIVQDHGHQIIPITEHNLGRNTYLFNISIKKHACNNWHMNFSLNRLMQWLFYWKNRMISAKSRVNQDFVSVAVVFSLTVYVHH